jgi:hypothetical protein
VRESVGAWGECEKHPAPRLYRRSVSSASEKTPLVKQLVIHATPAAKLLLDSALPLVEYVPAARLRRCAYGARAHTELSGTNGVPERVTDHPFTAQS